MRSVLAWSLLLLGTVACAAPARFVGPTEPYFAISAVPESKDTGPESEDTGPGSEEAAPAEREGSESEQFEPHHYARLFAGYTAERADGGFTAGLDYGYRFTRWVGFSAFGEMIFGHHPATVFGAGVSVHPIERVAIVVQPGVEFVHEQSPEFLMRLGVHANLIGSEDWELATGAFVDLFRGKTAWVLGGTLGFDF